MAEKRRQKIMPKRKSDSHKGDYGKLLIIGGSKGLTGAPAMSAEAALKCGTGLITVGTPKSINGILEVKLTEPMTCPLPDADGMLTKASLPYILNLMENCDALLFGPGLGRTAEIPEILKDILNLKDFNKINSNLKEHFYNNKDLKIKKILQKTLFDF